MLLLLPLWKQPPLQKSRVAGSCDELNKALQANLQQKNLCLAKSQAEERHPLLCMIHMILCSIARVVGARFYRSSGIFCHLKPLINLCEQTQKEFRTIQHMVVD